MPLFFSFPSSAPLVPSVPPRSVRLTLALLSKRAATLPLPSACEAPRAFIMHAKFHAEALRLASNPLITRCLRAPARAQRAPTHTPGRRVCSTTPRRAAPVRYTRVCATIFKSAREHPLLPFSLSLCATPRPSRLLAHRPPASAPALRFHSLTLSTFLTLSLCLSLSREMGSARQLPVVGQHASTIEMRLSRRVASRKNIPLVAGLDTCNTYVNSLAHIRGVNMV